MNYETLDQQTAPESTRGLFDLPEVSTSRINGFQMKAKKYSVCAHKYLLYRFPQEEAFQINAVLFMG